MTTTTLATATTTCLLSKKRPARQRQTPHSLYKGDQQGEREREREERGERERGQREREERERGKREANTHMEKRLPICAKGPNYSEK